MNIDVAFNKNFTAQYNKLYAKYGEEMASLNGISKDQLSVTYFIDKLKEIQVPDLDEEIEYGSEDSSDALADISIDGSANVRNKSVVSILNEMPKPIRKMVCFNKIYMEMQKRYGYKDANDWFEAEFNRALYMHDADTSTFKPYCYAYTLKKMAEEGLFFVKKQDAHFNNKPPKHLMTFVDFVKEFVSFNSNLTSGACGLPDLLPYMYYFWREDVKTDSYPRNKNPEEFAKSHIQRFIYAVNQPAVRDGVQAAFTNTNVFDRPYLEALFGGSEFPDGSFMIDDIEGIMQFQRWYLEEMADIREDNMFTYPVQSYSAIYKDHKWEDEEFMRWMVRHNMRWEDSNRYHSDTVTSLSNCCRLKSNIDDLGYFSSIGGTALRVGSVKVSTINLARIAYESETEQEYLVKLRAMTLLDLKVLDCVRNIIKRMAEKGVLPNYCDGLIDLSTQYNTIGVIGIYETLKKFGYITVDDFGNTFYTEKADSFAKRIFEVIIREKDQFVLDKDYKVSIEQIPGESAAAKLQQADKLLYPDLVVEDLPLYGNQFIPLGIQATLEERVRIASLFDSYCSGGSIAHINLDTPFTDFEQAWEFNNYLAEHGLTYSAVNVGIQTCKDNHAFHGKVCPKCGKPAAYEFTRIVGFFTPTDVWSSPRQEEKKLRKNYTIKNVENLNETAKTTEAT